MKTDTEKIISLLKRTFEKGAWHGPSVKEVLADVTAEGAQHRLSHTHSIIELVAHMISWRIFVIQKLGGNNAYMVTDGLNFPKRNDWDKVLQELEDSQQDLLAAIERFPIYKLGDLVPVSEQNYTYYTLLHGIIHHDLYHIGQIMLIKKATAAQTL
jgi:hypothetical protein